ncbi:UDP-glycosyltransferase 72C1 [Cardamine amara subsp. amara]|uniref:Glycosyltransferase n=1 Tax=Cardamine amara subsp. amara TaxID=228776 RepID=A0ABD1B979_CARAN
MVFHGALVASPGMGHAVPILELGKRLLNHHRFDRVTVFLVTDDVSRSKSLIGKLLTEEDPKFVIRFIQLDVSGQDLGGSLLTKLAEMMRKALPQIRSAVMGLEPRPSVFVVDLLGTEALAVAKELEIMKKHVLVTTSAWFLALTVYMASLDKETLYKHLSSRGALIIPGCNPVKFDPVEDPSNYLRELAESQRIGAEVVTADGVFVNTWHSLEPMTIGSFLDPENLGMVMRDVPVYSVGPLVRPAEPGLKHGVLDWLDLQPKESVVYVSFGSGGALTAEQTIELAYGLELSGQRFVWVVRPPAEHDPCASMFDKTNNETEPLDFLPDGFVDRTKYIGLVVRTWAPQEEILAHESTGGFVTHCGWNSVLESIVNGVPMVAWPLYSEQKMNAWMISEELKIASRVNVADGIVKKEEIVEMVKRVMDEEEGKEIRKNVKELKKTAEEALKKTHIPSAYFT